MTAWARRLSSFPLVCGRMIMPMSLGCAYWAAYNAWVVLTGRGLGTLLDGPIGTVLGAMSLLTAVLLTSGWWWHRMRWMLHGIILTACLLGTTSIAIWATPGVGNISAGYNVGWAVMAALAWLIEVRDARPERP